MMGTRPPLAMLTVALLSVCAGACGSSGAGTGTSRSSSNDAAAGGSATSNAASSTDPAGLYRNDGDNDPSNDNDPDDHDGTGVDDDSDSREDHQNPENDRYQDKDDAGIVSFGHAADAQDKSEVTALVKRYYAAAAVGDGAKACTTIVSNIAQTAAEDYGKAPGGPLYLRGSKTCAAVMSKLLERYHSRFAGSFVVTGVRVDGDNAYALLGSSTVPASYIILARRLGTWQVNGLLSGPLP